MRVSRSLCAGLLLALIAGCGRTPPNFVERPPLKGHTREVTSVAFAPDGKTLASRDSKSLRVWNLATRSVEHSLNRDGFDFGTVVFSPDGKTLAAEGEGLAPQSMALLWNPDAKPIIDLIELRTPVSKKPTRGWGLAFSPDGQWLVMGGSQDESDGRLTLWDLSSAESRNQAGIEFAPLKRPITSVSFHPDGRTIATGSMDGKIVLWDRVTRQQRRVIKANRSYQTPVVFSPDGKIVASADESRWVRFWDVASGEAVGNFKGHIKAVLSLAFQPDGRTLVSGDSGGTLFVWDVPSRKMMTRLESKDRGRIWSLAFSPDGRVLAAGSEDQWVHLWDVSEVVAPPKN